MLYSSGMSLYEGELSIEVNNAIREIVDFFSSKQFKILKVDDEYIAIPISFVVNIPPLGTVGGIDIKSNEPMLLKISLKRYPYRIPELLSDRKDFPKTSLSHLYVSQGPEAPASLCLVRNSPNEWFSKNRLTDLLIVGQEWLYKAATGALTDDGNEFDPTRILFRGHHAFQYEVLQKIVSNDERFIESFRMSVLYGGFCKNEPGHEDDEFLKTIFPVSFIQREKVLQAVRDFYSKKDFTVSLPVFSLLVWSDPSVIDHEYSIVLPKNFKELKEFLQDKGVDITNILNTFFEGRFNFATRICIVYALQRPKKMVGYDGRFEFITFYVDSTSFKLKSYPEQSEVKLLSHAEPFSKGLAMKLTGEERNTSALYIGAGSLGSKLIMHDGRSGKLKIGIADHDKFLEHNLARHVLNKSKLGRNKASAIREELSALFSFENAEYKAFECSIQDIPKTELNNYDWLVDSSASTLVQNWLSATALPESLKVARAELVDDGKLGLIYLEGVNRNPRVDDLINMAYYLATENSILKSWRQRDSERTLTNVDIGLGCSSTTTVMPDDLISFHASAFSRLLYQTSQKDQREGIIFLTSINEKRIPELSSKVFEIKPFESYYCQAKSGWEIRFIDGLSKKLLGHCKSKGKIETGGVLIGVVNYKTRTIHGFDILTQPDDSKGTSTSFVRGTKDLPRRIDTIKKLTGNVIGYVGEWHTHPMNLESLSTTDLQTVEALKPMNRRVPIPTLSLIITNTKILPFVFE